MGTIFSIIYEGIKSGLQKVGLYMDIMCKKAEHKDSFLCSCENVSLKNFFKCGALTVMLLALPILVGALIFYETPVIVESFEWFISSMESLFSFATTFALDFQSFSKDILGWIWKAKEWLTSVIARVGLSLEVDPRLILLTVYTFMAAATTNLLVDFLAIFRSLESSTSHRIYQFLHTPLTWVEDWLGSFNILFKWMAEAFFIPFSIVIYAVSFILGMIIDAIKYIL